MAMTINTNVASLNGQRNLASSAGKLNESLAKLSSGLRINSAKDDAAGLAVSSRMSSQIRGLDQASRNANDGISMAQTAEGALQESTNILQRIRELAVQSTNDTNTDSDRSSMQAEVKELTDELQRMAETTQFNGKNLLDGTLGDAVFQVGANAGANQTISFNIESSQTADLSQVGTTISGATDSTDISGNAIAAGSLSVNGTLMGATNGTNSGLATAINTATDSTIATAQNVQSLDFTTVDIAGVNATATGSMTGATAGGGDLTIGGQDVGAASNAVNLAANIESAATAAGLEVTATASGTTSVDSMKAFTAITLDATTMANDTAVQQGLDTAGALNINGADVGIVAADGHTAQSIATAIETAADNAAGGDSDIKVTVGNTTGSAMGSFNTEVEFSGDASAYTFTVDGVNLIDGQTGLNTDTLTAVEFDAAIQGHTDVTDNTGGSFTYDDGAGTAFSWTGTAASDTLAFTHADATDLVVTETFTLDGVETFTTGGFAAGTTTTDTTFGSLTIDSASGEAIDLTGSDDATKAGFANTDEIAANDTSYSLSVGGIDLEIDDSDGVTAADIDTAIAAHSSEFGAAGIAVTGTAGNDLTLTKADGTNLEVVQTIGADANTEGMTSLHNDGTTDTSYGKVSLSSEDDFTVGGTSAGFTASGLTTGVKEATVDGSYKINLDGNVIDIADIESIGEVTSQDIVDAIGATDAEGVTGFSAALNDDGQIDITKTDASSFTLTETLDADDSGSTDADAAGLSVGTVSTTYNGQVSLDGTSDVVIEEVTAGALASAGMNTTGNATTTIDQIDISTREGATTAITSVDSALQEINEMRGSMGAVQSRFESTINNLGTTSENISAARSRIVDADFASETAEMTKAQILQQAGTAMLAQANQLPQAVLSLLG